MSAVKQIKRILKDHDARDPRGALIAIEGVINERKLRKAATPATDAIKCLDLKVFVSESPDTPGALRFTVRVDHPADPEKTLRAVRAAGQTLNSLGEKLVGEAVSEMLSEVANRG